MRKIAIVGAGGINSWATKFLNEMLMKIEYDDYLITLFDKDEVEEKNIISNNQNFTAEDVMTCKAEALSKKYGFAFDACYIDETNISKLQHYDDIILGVDNNKTRELIYKFAIENNKYLLDMRAQATQIAYYVVDRKHDFEYYKKLLFNNPLVMERKGSCQLQRDIENKHIEMGNYIIACLGINACYLKHLRNEELAMDEFKVAY